MRTADHRGATAARVSEGEGGQVEELEGGNKHKLRTKTRIECGEIRAGGHLEKNKKKLVRLVSTIVHYFSFRSVCLDCPLQQQIFRPSLLAAIATVDT